MASKALLKKKKVSGDPMKLQENGLSAPPELKRHAVETCPTFWVQYLGKMPAKGEFGKEYISEAVEGLCRMREKQKLPKTALTISPKGFHFMDCHGPFGKEKHVIIPIHHVCYGMADVQYPRVFAVIVRSDSDPDCSLFECHAFLCEKRKMAQVITYWLLRTLLMAFENLQRKRHHRKGRERRKLEDQLRLNSSGSDTNSSRSSAENSQPQSHSEYVYSVTLEGSDEQGASVRISRNVKKRMPMYLTTAEGHGEVAAVTREPPVADPGLNNSSSPRGARPLRYGPGAMTEVDEINNPRYFKFRRKAPPRTPIYERHFSMDSEPLTVTSSQSSESGSYSESSAGGSGGGSSISGNSTSSNGDKDFIYIQMLQDEIASLDIEAGPSNDSDTNRTSKQIAHDLGVPSRLTDKDIHRRIHDWLRWTLKPEEEKGRKQDATTPKESTEVKVLDSRGDYF